MFSHSLNKPIRITKHLVIRAIPLFLFACLYAVTESVSAQGSATTVQKPTDFASLIALITDIIGTLVILIFALTLIVFMWGIIKGWIINGGEETGVKEGRQVVFVGIIALVIMSAIWGILELFRSSLFG